VNGAFWRQLDQGAVVHRSETSRLLGDLRLEAEDLNCKYRIDIVETNPAEIISIVNTDINIDFDQPLDYVEPVYSPPSPTAYTPQNKIISRETQLKSMQKPITKQFVAFSGEGNKLGSD